MIDLMEEDFRPMSAEESLAYFGVTLPEDGIVPGLALTGGGYGVYGTEEQGVYFDANSYEFSGGGMNVTLTLRTVLRLTPAPEQVKAGPDRIEFTEINGWELAIFRYRDGDGSECMYVEFALDDVICSINASGLGDEELAEALLNLLPRKEHIPGDVTVAGIVTAVDSRSSDYFDGTEHHSQEDHDYIVVDCDGARLTVWLPGEADRFCVGDSVTVTYRGEPATAGNIWKGQLESVG